jgi:hypothetical protein
LAREPDIRARRTAVVARHREPRAAFEAAFRGAAEPRQVATGTDDDIPFCAAMIGARCRSSLHRRRETLRGIRLSAIYVRPLVDNPWHPRHTTISPGSADTPGAMNDFHIALLWLRSLEIVIGHSPVIMLSELEIHDLFIRYRSPYKA